MSPDDKRLSDLKWAKVQARQAMRNAVTDFEIDTSSATGAVAALALAAFLNAHEDLKRARAQIEGSP